MEKGGLVLYLREMWFVKNRMNAIYSIGNYFLQGHNAK